LAARRDEEELLEKKRSEQHERDNPKMAKPNVAIPMPFAFPNDGDRAIALKVWQYLSVTLSILILIVITFSKRVSTLISSP
jgi:hypothetical protein